MKQPSKAPLLSVLIGIVAAIIIITVTIIGSVNPETEELVTVKLQGGLCVDGLCFTSYHVYSDGTVKYDDPNVRDRVVSDALIAQIENELQKPDIFANLQLDTNPSCASAYDGQDIIYIFPTLSDKEYSVCLYENSEQVAIFELAAQTQLGV